MDMAAQGLGAADGGGGSERQMVGGGGGGESDMNSKRLPLLLLLYRRWEAEKPLDSFASEAKSVLSLQINFSASKYK